MVENREKYKTILKAATKVFAQNGFYTSRVSDVAKEASVAIGTIYLYFKNKEDLIISIFVEAVQDLLDHVMQLKDQATPEVFLKTLVEQHLLRMEEDHDRAKVFQIELRQANPHIKEGIGQPLKGYFELIEVIITQGKEEGFFRQDIQTRLMRKMVFGTLDEICTRWVLSGCIYSLEEMVPSIMKLFMSAFMVPRTEKKEVM